MTSTHNHSAGEAGGITRCADRPSPTPERLRLDPDTYRSALSTLSLSPEQEDALLQALWEIMHVFVEIGWGDHAIQTIIPQLFAENILDTSDALAHDGEAGANEDTTLLKGEKT